MVLASHPAVKKKLTSSLIRGVDLILYHPSLRLKIQSGLLVYDNLMIQGFIHVQFSVSNTQVGSLSDMGSVLVVHCCKVQSSPWSKTYSVSATENDCSSKMFTLL